LPIFPYKKEQYQPYFDTALAYAALCSDGRHRISQHMSTADGAAILTCCGRRWATPGSITGSVRGHTLVSQSNSPMSWFHSGSSLG
jgi:hypothetical protein